MEIIITTTTKKLSKTILAQMPSANIKHLEHGIILGYVLNCFKDKYKAFLIEFEGEYYICATNWKKGTSSFYRRTYGKWSIDWKFSSPEVCDKNWIIYQQALSKATEHIYI